MPEQQADPEKQPMKQYDGDQPAVLPGAPMLAAADPSPEAAPGTVTDDGQDSGLPDMAEPAAAEDPSSADQPQTLPEDMAQPSPKPRKWRALKAALLLVTAVAIAGGAAAYYLKTTASQPGTTEVQAAQDKNLIEEVSQLVAVPPGETPAITTIVEEEKLDQPFLAQAREGDKVLLYFKAQRAIVYRPLTKQIVNMGPLTPPSPKVFVRNGTRKAVPESIEAKLIQSGQYVVASRDASPKRNYTKTVVVDLAGNRPDVAAELAKLLGASVAELPQGESRPEADLLVIVGSDAR